MKWTFTCFLPVHGGWGEWSNHWSECSTTCGLGMRTRERECDNPKPKYGGRPCEEQERQQVKYCRERDCDPGLILRLLLLSFYCMFVAAFPLAEFLCFHTGIKMTIAQLAWEKEIVGDSGTWSQMSPSSTHYEKCFLLNFLFFFFFFCLSLWQNIRLPAPEKAGNQAVARHLARGVNPVTGRSTVAKGPGAMMKTCERNNESGTSLGKSLRTILVFMQLTSLILKVCKICIR